MIDRCPKPDAIGAGWTAVADPAFGWQARVEHVTGQTMVEQITCRHRHRTRAAALRCAQRMAEPGRLVL